MAVLYVGDIGYRRFSAEPISSAENQSAGLRQQLQDQKIAIAKAKQAVQLLDDLERHALPHNLELARSSYQAWLLEVVKQCKLTAPKVDSGDPITRDVVSGMRCGTPAARRPASGAVGPTNRSVAKSSYA